MDKTEATPERMTSLDRRLAVLARRIEEERAGAKPTVCHGLTDTALTPRRDPNAAPPVIAGHQFPADCVVVSCEKVDVAIGVDHGAGDDVTTIAYRSGAGAAELVSMADSVHKMIDDECGLDSCGAMHQAGRHLYTVNDAPTGAAAEAKWKEYQAKRRMFNQDDQVDTWDSVTQDNRR